MDEANVEEFKTLLPLIEAVHDDFKELTRKNQNVPLSPTKIQMVNRLLARVKELLREEPSGAFLDLLNEDVIPQNSDALLILGQHKAALHRYRERWAQYSDISQSWVW